MEIVLLLILTGLLSVIMFFSLKKLIESLNKDSQKYYFKTMQALDKKIEEKNKETNESEIIVALQNNVKIEYEYYNLELNGEVIESVNSKEDAETIKEQLELQDITITQIITENVENTNNW